MPSHLGVPIFKSCFDWTVTVGQQSRAKITSFSVFIFSKFTWEAFFLKLFVLVARGVARELFPKLRIFLQIVLLIKCRGSC